MASFEKSSYEKNKVSFILSLFALFLSFIAICISIKTVNMVKNEVIDNQNETKNIQAKFIDNMPDVELRKQDGSIVVVKSYDSQDELNNIMHMQQEKQSIGEKKNVQQEVVKNNDTMKKNEKLKQKIDQNNKNKKTNKNTTTKKVNDDSNFVIQIGSFTEEKQAQKQCKLVANKLNNKKKCKVISNEDKKQFRSVIYQFKTKEEANSMTSQIQKIIKIKPLVVKVK